MNQEQTPVNSNVVLFKPFLERLHQDAEQKANKAYVRSLLMVAYAQGACFQILSPGASDKETEIIVAINIAKSLTKTLELALMALAEEEQRQ